MKGTLYAKPNFRFSSWWKLGLLCDSANCSLISQGKAFSVFEKKNRMMNIH